MVVIYQGLLPVSDSGFKEKKKHRDVSPVRSFGGRIIIYCLPKVAKWVLRQICMFAVLSHFGNATPSVDFSILSLQGKMLFTFSIYFWRKFRRKKKFPWHILKRTKIQPGFCVVKTWAISVSKYLCWRKQAERLGLVPGPGPRGGDTWQGQISPGKSANESCQKGPERRWLLPAPQGHGHPQ